MNITKLLDTVCLCVFYHQDAKFHFFGHSIDVSILLCCQRSAPLISLFIIFITYLIRKSRLVRDSTLHHRVHYRMIILTKRIERRTASKKWPMTSFNFKPFRFPTVNIFVGIARRFMRWEPEHNHERARARAVKIGGTKVLSSSCVGVVIVVAVYDVPTRHCVPFYPRCTSRNRETSHC